MSLSQFRQHITNLITTAEQMLGSSRSGKPEENTKNSLLVPFLDALGYTAEYRTLEGAIRSLFGTTTWVDYLLRPDVGKHPKLMFEAKSLWDKNIWETNAVQVLDYIRNYSLDIGTQDPVVWIVLSNFREWHILRLQDRRPFWSFTIDQLKNDPDLVNRLYTCLSRENLSSNRLEAFYSENTKEELGTKFLADLKIWRVIIANGIKKSQPNLKEDKIREAAQIILNRFLLIRLLETFSREMPFNYLGRVYYNWQQMFPNLPFIEQLRQAFRSTWVDYNTELFQPSWIDELMIDVEYLESIIVINAVPQEGILYAITGTLANYRSIYNYDFTTLTQDILGTAYEQFLAHQLIVVNDVIQILENQKTRKKEGIFYTPNYIVQRIVNQTLQPLVKPKIDQAIQLLEIGELQQAYVVAKSVLEITVLDPACGSGSFLLGAFDYLLTEIKRYNQVCQTTKIPDNFDLFTHVSVQSIINPEEQIIVKMLHGVDRDPQAVLLAKLSLWTRLLRARPGEYGRRNGSIYSHLPALTLNIRVGDSLIHSPANLAPFSEQLSIVADLAKIARDTSQTEIERNQAVSNLETGIAVINQEINAVLTAFFASDESINSVVYLIKNREAEAKEIELIRELITEDTNIEKTLENWTSAELARVKSELMSLETAQEEVIIKRPFNWEVEFSHIFDPRLPQSERGFCVIIGNPPYFNVDSTFGRGALELKWLKYAYSDIYTDKTDILFYFFRQGWEILKEDGYLSFIISRAFIQGDKSRSLRDFICKNTKIINIIDFLGYQVFKAGIATCILEFQRKTPQPEDTFTAFYVLDIDAVKENFGSDDCSLSLTQGVTQVDITQANLNDHRWQISPYNEIFAIIDSQGVKLREMDSIRYTEGITTGRDAIFEGEFINKFPDNYYLQRVSISSISSYGCEPPETQILYYTHQTEWKELPLSVQKYLQQNQLELENRDVYKNKTSHYQWFHLHRPRYGMRDAKILFPRRANANKFFIDEYGIFGFKSDVAAYVKGENIDVNILFCICSLLNSKVLEFRYRALGGIGKLTGKGMFEYFENQVGDLPIPQLNEENNSDYQELARLSREAHDIWQSRYQIVTNYQSKTSAIPHQEVSLNEYHKLSSDYAVDIEWESPNANQEGHLLELRIEPSANGYAICGEVSDDEDWQEGDREWIQIANVKIRNPHLRRYMLARLIYLTEFDSSFRRKRKLSSEIGNLVNITFDVLKVNRYDQDRFSNLRALEVIEKRVEQEVGRSDLETVLLRQTEIKNQIDKIAYRLYQVEDYIDIIEQALKVVL
ncbi:Eco57I restriction-modification methylase domain-containing protein [Dolichospermum sp. ST_sed9]|nr:Eco57I restriction-modification methylase domain-containing protein [Dolichospermum sp. ST_sed9]